MLLLMDHAACLSIRERVSPATGLTMVHRRLLVARSNLRRHRRLNDRQFFGRHGSLSKSGDQDEPKDESRGPALLCDAGLGGLARWLRAAGQEAIWIQDIDDEHLLLEAARLHATILTTDSLLMERRVLREGLIPAVWVSPTLRMLEQLGMVFLELNLDVRPARCMACGGELRQVKKERLRERIPPRTYRWLDDFYECARCSKLFWHGTHWRRIVDRLSMEVQQGRKAEH
ncbi:MAG: hypothetical protein JWR26_185 [Pedosphaera sp.]|nr:hypothetical protein [Pedosphaera sp.]